MWVLRSAFSYCCVDSDYTMSLGENDTLKWYTFNEGHAKAVREDKILLTNVSTDWCHPCKLMLKHTYSHRDVIDTLNKYFVCVYLNPDIERNYIFNGDSLSTINLVAYLFGEEQVAYPTTLFWFYPETQEKRSVHSGFMKPPDYLKLLAAAHAIRPFSKLGISLKID